jgi:hypothetical protein
MKIKEIIYFGILILNSICGFLTGLIGLGWFFEGKIFEITLLLPFTIIFLIIFFYYINKLVEISESNNGVN